MSEYCYISFLLCVRMPLPFGSFNGLQHLLLLKIYSQKKLIDLFSLGQCLLTYK